MLKLPALPSLASEHHSSPSPSPAGALPSVSSSFTQTPKSVASTFEKSRRFRRRWRWNIVAVPLVLILIAASTRYLSHPIALDLLSPNPPGDWKSWISILCNTQFHASHFDRDDGSNKTAIPGSVVQYYQHSRRDDSGTPDGITQVSTETQSTFASSLVEFPSTTVSASLTSSDGAPATTTTSLIIPTIPNEPPVLPTPFPQPFDTSLGSDFATQECDNFFVNMTQSTPFRQCRPFSLLSQYSSAFLQAQNNVTALNAMVWGTCNTTLSLEQCESNMAWFADQIQTSCSTDLKQQVTTVVEALAGLQAYSPLRQAGCLANPDTSTYCYIDAVYSSDVSDLYYYYLPLGSALPNNTTPSCSKCTQNLMSLYAENVGNLTGLQDSYDAAASLTQAKCGEGFVQSVATTSGGVRRRVGLSEICWVTLFGFLSLIAMQLS